MNEQREQRGAQKPAERDIRTTRKRYHYTPRKIAVDRVVRVTVERKNDKGAAPVEVDVDLRGREFEVVADGTFYHRDSGGTLRKVKDMMEQLALRQIATEHFKEGRAR